MEFLYVLHPNSGHIYLEAKLTEHNRSHFLRNIFLVRLFKLHVASRNIQVQQKDFANVFSVERKVRGDMAL